MHEQSRTETLQQIVKVRLVLHSYTRCCRSAMAMSKQAEQGSELRQSTVNARHMLSNVRVSARKRLLARAVSKRRKATVGKWKVAEKEKNQHVHLQSITGGGLPPNLYRDND